MKFNKKSVLNVVAWVFGVVFILIGLLVLLEKGYWMALSFVVTGAALIPYTSAFLKRKKNFNFSWKLKSVVIFAAFLLLVFTNQVVVISNSDFLIEKGDADVEILAGYVVELEEVMKSYEDAEIQTLAAYNIEFDSMSYEDYVVFTDEVIEKWGNTEQLANDFVAKYRPYVATEWSWFPVAYAAGLGSNETFDEMGGMQVNPWNELDPMNRIEHDEEIYNYKQTEEYKKQQLDKSRDIEKFHEYEQTEEYRKQQWNKVEATIMDNPQIPLLDAIAMHFGPGAGERKVMVSEHQEVMAPVWKDEIKFYGNMSNGARVVAVGSKVIVFTAGVYVTGGLAGIVEGGVLNATMVTAEGADLLLETGETISIVGFGNEEGPASIKTARGYLKYVTVLGSVKGLASNPAAMEELAGKLMNVYGLGSDALDLVMSIEGDKLKLKEEVAPKEARRSDEIFKLLQERHPGVTFAEYSKARTIEIEQWNEDRFKKMQDLGDKQAELKKIQDDKAAEDAAWAEAQKKSEAQKSGYLPVIEDFPVVDDYNSDMQTELQNQQYEDEYEDEDLSLENQAVQAVSDAAEVVNTPDPVEEVVPVEEPTPVDNSYLLAHPEEITDCGLCQSLGGGCTTTQNVAGWYCNFDWR